jgi:arylformamidase
MRIYDVTRPLSPGTPVYPGDLTPVFTRRDHGPYLTTELFLSSHSGTHIDAPVHFLKKGMTVDQIPTGKLTGPCRVLDFTGITGEIAPEMLSGEIDGARKILLKTSFSGMDHFVPEFTALSPRAVPLLAEAGIHCVGIDSPSIESFTSDGRVHRSLMEEEIVIIEMLDLSRVVPGDYLMVALPLLLRGVDASPARVILCDNFRSTHGPDR